MSMLRVSWLTIATAAMLGIAGIASAETKLFNVNLEGEIETGFRFYAEKPNDKERAKFEEYRDFPANRPFLDTLRLRIFRPDESYSAEFEGSKWGQEDQEFSLRSGRLGLWQFEFEWNQTPHIFSTNARMLATESGRGVFTLPSPRPAVNAANYNTARELDEIGTRWDTARLLFRLTPTPDLEISAEYTRINKDGDRPMGMVFGTPGSNLLEILEPIEQTVHELKLLGSVMREQWQLQFGYVLSVFRNSVSSLTADNPLAATDGAFAGGSSTPGSGRMSLAPDNMAHTFNVTGGVNLPMRTRVNASFTYSLRLQNDNFLPHTRNPVIIANDATNALRLPQTSLDGLVGTALFNVVATTRPISPLTLTAKYRLYDFNDMSDEPHFTGNVENDNVLRVDERTAGRPAYTKHNLDLDGRWRFMSPVALTLGTGWERWDRNEHREVERSDEIFAKAALDVTLCDGCLLARLTYKPSFRRIGPYNTFAHLTHTVGPEEAEAEAAQSQSILLRKLDESSRNRQRVDLVLQLMPFDNLTTTLTGGWRFDDYFGSTLGLQEETGWSAGIDSNWSPIERLSLFGGYVYEKISQQMRSRNRPVTGTTTFDFVDFEWVSDLIDTIHTANLGLNAVLIPRLLDLGIVGNYSVSRGKVKTVNPLTPTSGTAAQDATATARPFPDFSDSLLRLETNLKYHFLKVWTAGVFYAFERFTKHDWRTDTLTPFNGFTSIWLGNDLKNYTAHILGLKVGYKFE